jgi:uncharacterized protein YabN with tetrapyrrole methylase and pyrophosphatase domain
MKRGSLCAVGIGIRAPAQTTLEASQRIQDADKVFSIVADSLSDYWLSKLNASTESLSRFYAVGKQRRQTYLEMVDCIVSKVRENQRVCVVSYGHPGVAAFPLHESVRRVRAEGFEAEMLAAVSAQDCLFADLGIDPVDGGLCSYEATDFLVNRRGADPASKLLLWQIGVIGELSFRPSDRAWNPDGIAVLTERLLETYPPDHEVVVYDAAQLPIGSPTIERVALRDLPQAPVAALSTLYVPPSENAVADELMMRRLRLRQ